MVNRTFKLNLQPEQFQRIMQTGLPLHEEIDVPVNDVYLRIAVHDLTSDRTGSMEIPLTVSEKTQQK